MGTLRREGIIREVYGRLASYFVENIYFHFSYDSSKKSLDSSKFLSQHPDAAVHVLGDGGDVTLTKPRAWAGAHQALIGAGPRMYRAPAPRSAI